jgi:fructokinase
VFGVNDQLSLWVLGEALMDCVAREDGLLQPLLGGSPFNLACAAALQGTHVGWVTQFSSDSFGQALSQRLKACGGMPLQAPSSKPTSLAVVNLHEGQPSYGFYREGVADRQYRVADVCALLQSHAPGVLHTGSLMAVPPENSKVLEIVKFAKRLGWIISVDVNLRPKLAVDLNQYLASVVELASHAHWLKASDEDMMILGLHDVTPQNAQGLAQHWLDQGCERVALTFGSEGAWLQIGETQAWGSGQKVEIKDTVGAGDTFWGTCLTDWMQLDALGESAQAKAAINETLKRANAAAAMNCMELGCQPPTREALGRWVVGG